MFMVDVCVDVFQWEQLHGKMFKPSCFQIFVVIESDGEHV